VNKQTILRFLKQPSTWKGITWFLTVCGIMLSSEQQEAIGIAGIGVVALIETFSDEDKRKVFLPEIKLQSKSQFDDQDDGYISRAALRSQLHRRSEDYPKESDERGVNETSGWNR
jgi:hypothetical protein